MTKKQVESFLYVVAAISGFILFRDASLSWPIKIALIFFVVFFCGTFVAILEWLERRDFMEVNPTGKIRVALARAYGFLV